MVEENLSQEFRFKNIEEIKNYFIQEIHQNELISDKHKNFFPVLNYIEHLLILASTVAIFISRSSFDFCLIFI